MSSWVHRIGRISLWILPLLLAINILASVADSVWFRTQLPIGFHDANWTGKWETKHYWGLSGRLLVRLPDPIPENQDFQTEALVYYPIYSVWKTGQFVKMDFAGRFNSESSSSAGETANRIPSQRGILKFKATAGNQVVEYTAIRDDSGTKIIGAYLSRTPDDYGNFSIRYY